MALFLTGVINDAARSKWPGRDALLSETQGEREPGRRGGGGSALWVWAEVSLSKALETLGAVSVNAGRL